MIANRMTEIDSA